MTKKIILTLIIGLLPFLLLAQKVIQLWPNGAPGTSEWNWKEGKTSSGPGESVVFNVVKPTLTVYVPDRLKANGTAIVICLGTFAVVYCR